MLDHIKSLTDEEKNLVLHAPMYVSILIAGADGDINTDEKNRVLELIHTKTFSERYELRDLYQTLDINAADELRRMIASLPDETVERNQLLSDMIARLNHIFPRLERTFAIQLYNSLRQFASYVANADGGWWGVAAVNEAERAFVKLPMLNDPSKQEE